MNSNLRRWLACMVVVFAGAGPVHASETRVVVPVDGEFDDVRSYLLDAIAGEGLVISYTAHVQSMLERTATATGSSVQVYGDAEVMEFCSAPLTRQLLEDDPHAIVQCPYRIAVYTLDGEPQTTYLAYPRPTAAGDSPGLAAVEALLEAIVEASL